MAIHKECANGALLLSSACNEPRQIPLEINVYNICNSVPGTLAMDAKRRAVGGDVFDPKFAELANAESRRNHESDGGSQHCVCAVRFAYIKFAEGREQ